MEVIFESRAKDGLELRELAVRRVHFVMRRLAWMVPYARVHMSDVNGPRGGLDKRCLVELETASTGTVVISSTARDWRSALDAALARSARVLKRTLQRGGDKARSTKRDVNVAAEAGESA